MSWTHVASALLMGALCVCCGEDRVSCPIKGVVLDVQDGEPLVGVRVEGPSDTRAVTDPQGRFVLSGCDEGEDGSVRAWRSDGWEAKVPLRPLRAGGLEVVLHLAPQRVGPLCDCISAQKCKCSPKKDLGR